MMCSSTCWTATGRAARLRAGVERHVVVNPAETVRLIMQFTDYADPHLPYMFHCHILEHEDMGMMGQFVVVDNPIRPGERPVAAARRAGRAQSAALDGTTDDRRRTTDDE